MPSAEKAATMTLASPVLVAPNMLGEQTATLRRHVQQCSLARGRWFGAAALGERVHGWIAPRLISTVAVVLVLMGLVAEWV
ncbi:MAG: hypothetical protein H7Z19_09715 [Chitinophagaceae bacterium]|nr:hypothetical protein [Rubrivivax sp.]